MLLVQKRLRTTASDKVDTIAKVFKTKRNGGIDLYASGIMFFKAYKRKGPG